MKKIVKNTIILFVFIVIFASFFVFSAQNITGLSVSFGTSSSFLTVSDDLKKENEKNLDYFDFSSLDEALTNLENNEIFGESTFKDKVKDLVNGDYSLEFKDVLSYILSVFFSGLKDIIPLLATIVAIAILSNIIGQFKGKRNLGEIVHFVCFCAVIILVCSNVTSLIKLAQKTIFSMQSQMEIVFPIILTLMASIGNTVSVGIYQPILALLSGIIINVFSYVVFPIFIISFVVSIVGNLSNNVKLNKFSSFLNDIFKWVIGIVFTLFTGIMTIKGISAGSFDSVSIRTTKFALKTYIPIVGGYLSDGFNLIMASSILIKNAVGSAGLLLIFLSIISPIITILVFKWAIHLTSAFLEPLFDNKISNFLFSVSKAINMLISSILCVALMYLISVGLLMTTGNVYWG